MKWLYGILILTVLAFLTGLAQDEKTVTEKEDNTNMENTEIATFGGGCFWGVEATFRQVPGVVATSVGYIGGKTENPTYEEVCGKTTGHAEAVEVIFDPAKVGYDKLLTVFFENHDPTQLNRQGPDVGDQYRSAVFYHSEEQKVASEKAIEKLTAMQKFKRPIVTQVVAAGEFYLAEDYHQQYLEKRGLSSCGFNNH